ncbi:glucuronide carrier protein [Thermocatellispora tengchongensis]|uniref:Glucuronide carrier protein n=1 Tax=Thermocatellispora tengchongensis TaxID=1073253 RepID=A0A840PAK4_9ACTN|nr:glucuronide transporter [Thermocatellispora tengchongensis]MBB5135706.1 glucuronide carrier protein [Thermocatellispora tengchongensis]
MKLRRIQVIGYGAGDAGNNLAFSLTSMFLLVYYTDVVGLSPAAVGTMFLIVRIWDALADILAGRLVDRTQTRWGKFRPYILFGAVPLLLLNVATFHVPEMSSGAELAYAYVTYALLGLAYSLVNIPYGSLATAMTQEPRERARLAAARGVGVAVIILILVLVISPALQGGGDLQGTLTAVTWIFAVAGAAMYLFTFLTSKEAVPRAVARVTLRQTVAAMRGNRPLLMLCASALVYLTGMSSLTAVGVYYARDVLGDPSLFIVLTVVTTAELFVVAPLAPVLVARIGKRRAYVLSGGLSVAGGLGVFLAPADPVALPIFFWAVAGLGTALVNTLMWALEADTVEYGEWRSGVRTEGATYAVFSFTRKLGQALGAAAGAYALALGGYAAQAAQQSEGALTAIRFAAGAAPAVTALLAIAIMWFYPLTERRFAEIVTEVAQRRDHASAPDKQPREALDR